MILPRVTVIMPIRNEAAFIERSLGAVIGQDYPADRLEIIVADGMSTDGTQNIIRSLQAVHPHLKLLDNPKEIVSTGFNSALRLATGEIIVRVDGHTEIASDYVRQCVAELERSGADNVGGMMRAVGGGTFSDAVACATSSPFGVGGARFHYVDKEEWVDTVYMGAWPQKLFERIGHFDEEQIRNQDDEFNYRLGERGGRILLSPRIRSCYTVRGTPRSLWNQYFQYGFWKVRVMQKHPRQMQPRQFVPLIFVFSLVVFLISAFFSEIGRWMLAILCGVYITANLSASAWEARKKDYQLLPLLPVVFAILHVSYGLGFMKGLFKFWNRWGDSGNHSCQLSISSDSQERL